jgi:hypothetical protein
MPGVRRPRLDSAAGRKLPVGVVRVCNGVQVGSNATAETHRPSRISTVLAFAAALIAIPLVFAALPKGCEGSRPEAYETKAGKPTRLNGNKTAVDALDVSEAVRLQPQGTVYVRGYLLAPRDDSTRLCTRLEKSGLCRKPSLVLDASEVNLDGASALEVGCCAIGLWSPRPVVLQVDFRGRTPRIVG